MGIWYKAVQSSSSSSSSEAAWKQQPSEMMPNPCSLTLDSVSSFLEYFGSLFDIFIVGKHSGNNSRHFIGIVFGMCFVGCYLLICYWKWSPRGRPELASFGAIVFYFLLWHQFRRRLPIVCFRALWFKLLMPYGNSSVALRPKLLLHIVFNRCYIAFGLGCC